LSRQKKTPSKLGYAQHMWCDTNF